MRPESRLEQRSIRLARALARLGLGPGHKVAVLCCPVHQSDRRVAEQAAPKAGAEVHSVDPTSGRPLVSRRLEGMRFRFVLACPEGVAVYHALGMLGTLVADAPNALWWPAIEGRENDIPLTQTGGLRAARPVA